MERIRNNQNLCSILREALSYADMPVGPIRMTVSDGRIVIDRLEEESGDLRPAEDDGVFDAYEYILDHADEDELLNVYETLTSEMLERGVITSVEE